MQDLANRNRSFGVEVYVDSVGKNSESHWSIYGIQLKEKII